jgi:hypothetical protein
LIPAADRSQDKEIAAKEAVRPDHRRERPENRPALKIFRSLLDRHERDLIKNVIGKRQFLLARGQ